MLMNQDIIDDGKNIKFEENSETFYTRLSLETFREDYLKILINK